jgi:hypothetical protein
MGLVGVRRPYVVALCLAIAAVGAGFASGMGHSKAKRAPAERQLRAMEAAALTRLKFPQDFVRRTHACTTARCYVVAASSQRIASMMPGLLRSYGFQAAGSLRFAEPIAALKAGHWSTSSRDPLVIACKTSHSSSHAALISCQDAGRFGDTLVNVLVRPYEPCNKESCAQSTKTEVLAWSAALPGYG